MGWATSSGVSIHYEVSGRGQRSLILVHELGGTLGSWDAVMPLLEPEFHILRFDQRGFGQSEKVRKPFSIDDHVQDLQNIIDVVELPPPYYLVGLAAGAAVVLGFLQQRGVDAAAAVLCAAATDAGPERRQFLRDRAELACREGMRAVADATLARSFPPVVRRDAAMFEDYRGRLLANDPVCYAAASRALLEAHLDEAIAHLRCRCLVLAGAHDGLQPLEDVAALARCLAGAEFAVLDTAHVMPVQAPELLAEHLLEFFLR